jgi:hypothetical protein
MSRVDDSEVVESKIGAGFFKPSPVFLYSGVSQLRVVLLMSEQNRVAATVCPRDDA